MTTPPDLSDVHPIDRAAVQALLAWCRVNDVPFTIEAGRVRLELPWSSAAVLGGALLKLELVTEGAFALTAFAKRLLRRG